METEEEKIGIPDTVTINGVVYSVKETPALVEFMQRVAKVEKNKLYSQFENLKSQIATLGKAKIVPDSSEKPQNFNVEELVEKLKGTFITKDDLKDTVREVVQPVLAATEQNRQTELETFREDLIKQNLGACIPDLVKGETKEELLASLKESIRIRSQYPSPSSASTDGKPVVDPLIVKQQRELSENLAGTPTPQMTEIPTPPATPRREAPAVTGPTNIKEMPITEFSQRREQLEQELRAIYG